MAYGMAIDLDHDAVIEIECRKAIEIEWGKISEMAGGTVIEIALYYRIINGIWDGSRSSS